MRILLFDPFHGAAGDMVTAALLALGADRSLVIEAMRSVVAEPTVEEVERGGIRSILISTHATATSRSLAEVLARVNEARAPPPAVAMARRVFLRLHEAEASIHGERPHFHEVGADDAIADVLGACTALHSLRVDGVAVLPILLGGGEISGSHGAVPVPAPATAAILQRSGLQVRAGRSTDGELCTPTGAALLSEFSSLEPPHGPLRIRAVGYGAGRRDTPGIPNVLRAMIVDTDSAFERDCVDVLETNVDDVSGEVLSHTLSRLMDAGARDASAVPLMMKKGRIGFLVRVISLPPDTLRLAEILAEELGTLGIRCSTAVHRLITRRTIEPVALRLQGRDFSVDVKCSYMRDRLVSLKPEFEQVRRWAEELHLPIRDVMREAETAAREKLGEEQIR
ncbi:MAG: nickel pincer cofactor biosynthesis protein LarC [Methanomicrobiales archaeon]|nr:nickel pincer cofactor biosynthesis protein LarC [Methanomicrobiales archaeon]MDI6876885.1 nickel pincer cofactor biosynthesis protein LarC [Methanomicrobiales archaeon]